ncbi:MAG TPA: LptF/LptG family permease [Verrucomicrobiota bacterium]|nr:LptF/LptG family permease [Verrucomicrobiota bacterium]HNT13722.1 LptF/LptG family permease [Verrucomicrobiota bacterium]
MRLLDRYLLRELLSPLAYCLGGFFIFWTSSDLFERIDRFKEAHVGVPDVVRYYVIRAPEFLDVVLPVALLLALLYALTQHARNNEITAMRAAGISLWRLAAPYLLIGLLASIGLFVVNEKFAPDAEERADALISRTGRRPDGRSPAPQAVIRNLGFMNARDGHNWAIKEFNAETLTMLNPLIVSPGTNGAPTWFYASSAVYSNGVWVFFNAREYRSDPAAEASPVPTLQFPVLARPDLKETPEEIRSEVLINQRAGARRRHHAELPLSDIRSYLALHPDLTPATRSWLYTRLHSRIASPWKCFVVVLIALPFGASSGRRNIFAGVAGSIGICLAYFTVMEISQAAGTAGHLPAWIAGWLPNLSFALIALWLIHRVR